MPLNMARNMLETSDKTTSLLHATGRKALFPIILLSIPFAHNAFDPTQTFQRPNSAYLFRRQLLPWRLVRPLAVLCVMFGRRTIVLSDIMKLKHYSRKHSSLSPPPHRSVNS